MDNENKSTKKITLTLDLERINKGGFNKEIEIEFVKFVSLFPIKSYSKLIGKVKGEDMIAFAIRRAYTYSMQIYNLKDCSYLNLELLNDRAFLKRVCTVEQINKARIETLKKEDEQVRQYAESGYDTLYECYDHYYKYAEIYFKEDEQDITLEEADKEYLSMLDFIKKMDKSNYIKRLIETDILNKEEQYYKFLKHEVDVGYSNYIINTLFCSQVIDKLKLKPRVHGLSLICRMIRNDTARHRNITKFVRKINSLSPDELDILHEDIENAFNRHIVFDEFENPMQDAVDFYLSNGFYTSPEIETKKPKQINKKDETIFGF